MHRTLARATLGLMLLTLACNGSDGDGGVFNGVPTFVPDRAAAEGEFFLVGGAVHDDLMDLELHVRWPEGKGSLGVVFLYLKLPTGYELRDVRVAGDWPAWPGPPLTIHATASTSDGLWYFGATPGPNEADESGNRCDPFPEPRVGDLHVATLTVRLSRVRPARVDVVWSDRDNRETWYCRDATTAFLLHPVVVGGVIH